VRGRGRQKRSTGKHAGDGHDDGVGRVGWWKHGIGRRWVGEHPETERSEKAVPNEEDEDTRLVGN
jgi:hypothetical protein